MTKQYVFHGQGQDLSLNKHIIDLNEHAVINLSGNFNSVTMFGLGSADQLIKVCPEQNSQVFMRRLAINQCENIKVSGLERMTVNGTASQAGVLPYKAMVHVNGDYCIVEGLKVYSAEDTQGWLATDWQQQARNGIQLSGHACIARCNQVTNVRNGIEVRCPQGKAVNNHVSHFYGDGMRALADNVTLVNNQIMMARDSGNDRIHSDAIQMWNLSAASPGLGILEGVDILYNNIWNCSERAGSRLMQGIGCFDGVARNVRVIGNRVMTDHYHGITLGIAQNALIEQNTVLSTRPEVVSSWIKIGTNKPTDFISAGNVLAFNESASYVFQPGMVNQNIANSTLETPHFDELYEFEQARMIA